MKINSVTKPVGLDFNVGRPNGALQELLHHSDTVESRVRTAGRIPSPEPLIQDKERAAFEPVR